jgi:starch phosphorylase
MPAPGDDRIAVRGRLGLDAASLQHDFAEKLFYQLMKFPSVATTNDHYLALSWVVRDRLLERWIASAREYLDGKHRTVIYLSAEYLPGPQLASAMQALDITREVRAALEELGLSLDALVEYEEEPGLGNGGLGRLAACFMDSLATLQVPAIGHGIRYEFGIFDQVIRDGWQCEVADKWLRKGFPWEVRRYDIELTVGLGGHTEHVSDGNGGFRMKWVPERIVKGVPYDVPVLGSGTHNTNFLRLWSAIADEELDLGAFQAGDYRRAVDAKIRSENITRVLYPADDSLAGKQLRLEQEYFFVSCALQDCIRLLQQRTTLDEFADKFAFQLNDTHPALAVAELMRLLVDVHGLEWEDAWTTTTRSISYTNHTLMPEALERWPRALFAQLLPRHMEIIDEINRRLCDEVRRRTHDEARVKRMSIVDEGAQTVRMAHLAAAASHTINGVSELHSQLLRETVLADFAQLWPERFTNVTNGVTPRRFVALANPGLAALLDEAIGPGWVRDLERLRELERFADDAAFRERWRAVKRGNKAAFASWVARTGGRELDPDALLDAQCKRMHEYKRQLLNLLHVVHVHQRLRRGDTAGLVPRTIVMAGKAAPTYHVAKMYIRLCTAIADAVAADPATQGWLRVAFVPDFNVKVAQHIYPAADLSEQISTAGTEASGTGNMKFALNGALTIGTLDGANVEIRALVGADEFFLFGLTTEEVVARRRAGYQPREVIERDPELAAVLDAIAGGAYAPDHPDLFAALIQHLRDHDPFFVLADFRSYVECQARVAARWRDVDSWTRGSIRNVARCGKFSSDRAIREYCERIWKVPPVPIRLP